MSVLRPNLVPGLLPNVVSVLKEHGITTVTEFLIHDEEEILKKINEKVKVKHQQGQKEVHQPPIKIKDLISLKKEFHDKFSGTIENGFDLYQALERKYISTGSERLDELLEGGIQEGELTEVCGGIATGKSQFCMGCACTAIKNGYSVYYIDTSCSFSASRIFELLGENCENKESLLSSIQHKVCSDIFEIFEVLEEIITILQTKKEDNKEHELIIVDCIASVIYPILGGNQMDGYSLLVKLGQKLKYLAVQYSTTVLITNNIIYSEGGDSAPSLGRAWSHTPHTRIMIKLSQQSNSLERKIVLIKSSIQAVPQECVYYIQEGVG